MISGAGIQSDVVAHILVRIRYAVACRHCHGELHTVMTELSLNVINQEIELIR